MHSTTDTPHYENVPFEIPNSWCWAIGEEIFSPMQSTRPMGISFKYIDIDAIDNTKCKIQQVKTLETKDAPSRATRYTEIGDVLFSMVRPYLRNIAKVTESDCIASTGFFVCSTNGSIVADYCYYLMISDYVVNGLNQFMKGDNSPSINNKHIATWLYPIPPLAEQKRIVAGIGKWFALIDQIEQGKVDLQTAIKQTKSKILDLAIHGKLVPQDPNEEPASELLKRINPKAETTCDNGQYGKIPKGWCLVTGTFLFKQMKSAKPKGKLFKYIDIDSIDNKSNIVSSIKEIPTIEAPSRASRYTEKGDVVFSMVRPYLRNIAQITENYCIASTGFYICSPYNCMLSKFCYYLMLSNYVVDGLNTFMKGDNSPSITKREIDNWLYPLPPMNEQYRIVAKIEEIFTILDRIELSLRMS